MNARRLLTLVICGLCLITATALSNGTAPAPAPASATAPAPKAQPMMPVLFEGTSSKGNFEEALKQAIDNAMASRKGISDAMVEWELKGMSGAQGGIAGVNRLTVTIEVKPQ